MERSIDNTECDGRWQGGDSSPVWAHTGLGSLRACRGMISRWRGPYFHYFLLRVVLGATNCVPAAFSSGGCQRGSALACTLGGGVNVAASGGVASEESKKDGCDKW